MALPPKVPSYASSPAIATAVSRVAYRGRPTAVPQIEELNQAAVGTDGEWTPAEPGRNVASADSVAGKAKGPGFSSTLARMAFGYQANEATRGPQAATAGPQSQTAAGAYETVLRVTNVAGLSAGHRHNRFY